MIYFSVTVKKRLHLYLCTVFILLCKPGHDQWWLSACVIHLQSGCRVCRSAAARGDCETGCLWVLWEGAHGSTRWALRRCCKTIRAFTSVLETPTSLQQHRKKLLDLLLVAFDIKSCQVGLEDLATKSLSLQHTPVNLRQYVSLEPCNMSINNTIWRHLVWVKYICYRIINVLQCLEVGSHGELYWLDLRGACPTLKEESPWSPDTGGSGGSRQPTEPKTETGTLWRRGGGGSRTG